MKDSSGLSFGLRTSQLSNEKEKDVNNDKIERESRIVTIDCYTTPHRTDSILYSKIFGGQKSFV